MSERSRSKPSEEEDTTSNGGGEGLDRMGEADKSTERSSESEEMVVGGGELAGGHRRISSDGGCGHAYTPQSGVVSFALQQYLVSSLVTWYYSIIGIAILLQYYSVIIILYVLTCTCTN